MSSKILASIGRHSIALEGGYKEGCSLKLSRPRARQSTSLAAVQLYQSQTTNPSTGLLTSSSLNGALPSPRSLSAGVYTKPGPVMNFNFLLPLDKSRFEQPAKDPFKFLDDQTNGNTVWITAPSSNTYGASVLAGKASPQKEQPAQESPSEDKPNMDQLQRIHETLADSLTKIFKQPMNYSVYHTDIIFIDNIRNITTQGIMGYVQQVALLRGVGHVKFAYVGFEILNSNISVEESRITMRWRIRGISGLRVMFKFWKIRLWDWKSVINQQENWYDGISHFEIGPDCLIHRHIAEKVMEDKDRELDVAKHTAKTALAAKLGVLAAALFPNPSLTFLSKSDTHSTSHI